LIDYLILLLVANFMLVKAVQVRVGYDNAVRNAVNSDGQSSTAGFSGGVGIVTNKVNIDYGATVLFRSGTLHRIGVNLSL
jgi:hypothetical protein